MKLLDVLWTDEVNMMKVLCDCGNRFLARVDRYTVRCPFCRAHTHIDNVRGQKFWVQPKGGDH